MTCTESVTAPHKRTEMRGCASKRTSRALADAKSTMAGRAAAAAPVVESGTAGTAASPRAAAVSTATLVTHAGGAGVCCAPSGVTTVAAIDARTSIRALMVRRFASTIVPGTANAAFFLHAAAA